MPPVVQKFGGTSVADAAAIQRLIDIVRAARLRDGHGPAVVVSAMSGATDTLLKLASTASSGRVDDAVAAVEGLRDRHHAAAGSLAPGDASLRAAIDEGCDALLAVARALSVLRDVSPRTLDAVAASGEFLSSKLVAAALEAAGVPSTWIDARGAIVTDGEHTRAAPRMPETIDAVRRTVGAAI